MIIRFTATFCVQTATKWLLELKGLVPAKYHPDNLPNHSCITTNFSDKLVKSINRPFLIKDFCVLDQLDAKQTYVH